MKALGIIPARFSSTRFPGKPLIDLKGKTMIQRVYERVVGAKLFSTVVVATDDQRIYDHVIEFGGNVMMTSSTHETGTDRCGEVIETYSDYDIVVNVQGDEPLVDPIQLAQLLEAFEDADVTIATLGTTNCSKEEQLDPNRIKLVTTIHQDAMYFSRASIPFERNPIPELPIIRHIGLYAFKRTTLEQLVKLPLSPLEQMESLEQLRWLYNGYSIRVVMTNIETPNIDVPEDVETVINLLD